MAEIHAKKGLFAFKFLHQREPKVPFCPEVRDFIAESHKCQTLYANCEGFNRRRLKSYQNEKLLEDFIFNFMYYYEYNEQESQSFSDRMVHVRQICSKIVSLSKEYDLDEEIHFSVVWVYYFDYNLRTTQATPVFKIFKKKSGNEAVFLDVFLKSYESWDCYLETAEFKNSFLCIPQHGQYCFDAETNKLILEYMCPMKLKTNEKDCLFAIFAKVPFSQVAVRPLFTEVASFTRKKAEQMTLYFRALCSYWKEFSGSIWNVALFILLVFKKIKKFSVISLRTFPVHIFMLFNTVRETGDFSNLLKFDYWSKHVSSFVLNSLTFSDEQKAITKIYDEGAHFIRLLMSPQKDWLDILQSFCSLFRYSRHILNELLYLFPDYLIIKILTMLLNMIENISEGAVSVSSCEMSKIKNLTSEINTDQDKNRNPGVDSLMLSTVYSNSSVFDNQYELPFTLDAGPQNAVDQFNYVSYENILPNLFSLETASANENYVRLLKKSSAKLFQNVLPCLPGPSFAEIGILVEKLDDYGIFLFHKASVPQLTWYISRFIKTDFSFKPRGIFTLEITNRFEEFFGYLFFPLEFTALGLFPLEIILEDGEEHIQSEWIF